MPENSEKKNEYIDERPTDQRPLASEAQDPVHDLYFGTAERTEERSSYVADSFYYPYNPDDLYQKRGDHLLYEEMSHDDQVSVCLQLKKDLIIGNGWDILTDDDDDSTKDIAEDIYLRLEQDPEQSLDDYLDVWYDNAQKYGFGCAEKRFMKRPDGSLTLRTLKTRHPDSWLIHTDEFGNIKHYESRGSKTEKKIDPKAILKYTPTISDVGPYGVSDLRKVYNAWFTKRHLIRYFAIFAESVASAKPIAKYDKVVPQDKITEMYNIIKNFQNKTAMVIPKEFEVEFLEAKNQGDAYIKGIDMFNMFIGRGLFIPDLLGFQGSSSSSGGSQALGREQVDMFLKHVMRRRRSIERLINREIIQPICVYNYGVMKSYPKFQFRPPTEEDTKEYARIFLEAVKGKLYRPTDDEINHLRSLIKFPEGNVDRPEPQQNPGFPTLGQPGMPGNPEQPDPNNPDDMGKNKPEMQSQDPNEMGDKKEKFTAFLKPDGDFHNKVNFAALENELNASEQQLIAELRPLMELQFEDLYEQMRRKKIVGDNPKPERIKTIKLKYLKKMNAIIKKNLLESYKRQGNIAQSELFKNNFANIMPPDTFFELLDYEVFEYLGDYEYRITQGARQAMIDAIRDGQSIASVIDIVDSTVKGDATVSLERYSRTKHTDVMNQARLAFFNDSNVVEAYQFSAIMDARVSDICAGLHGKIISKEKIGNFTPPLHFNCRSTLIPITIFETWTEDDTAGGVVTVREQTQPGAKNRVKEVRREIPEQDIDRFLEENHGLRIRGTDSTRKNLQDIRRSRGQ